MTTRAYTVRVSRRAKYVRLKHSARDGLVVIVPQGFDESRIPRILEKKRDWIQKTQERLREQRKYIAAQAMGKLPDRVTLRVIDEEWAVSYRLTEAKTVTAVERTAKRLLVFGDIEDGQATKDALRRWIARKTHEHAVPWLMRLASEKGFEVSRVMVKSQRTRWASCSSRGTISLNLRLMFLPEHLVRYVFLHELAHIRETDHSRRFWAWISTLDEDFVIHDEELRTAWRLVPPWIGLQRLSPVSAP